MACRFQLSTPQEESMFPAAFRRAFPHNISPKPKPLCNAATLTPSLAFSQIKKTPFKVLFLFDLHLFTIGERNSVAIKRNADKIDCTEAHKDIDDACNNA